MIKRGLMSKYVLQYDVSYSLLPFVKRYMVDINFLC